MFTRPSRQRLMVGVWLAAAALSFIAAFLPVLKGGDPNAASAAPGAFCLIMAIITSRRKPMPPSR